MSDIIQRFLVLEKQKQAYKNYIKELEEATEALVKHLGVNAYFQDAEGTVYKTEECTGRYVHFSKYTYSRTKRGDEKRGELSVKEAQEAGFKVGKDA
jgi:hypothetical protein